MPEQLFSNLFGNTSTFTIGSFLLALCASLIIGALIAITYTYKSKYTKSFVVTLALLPAVVCLVIMMINGNIGVGVAVAGAFNLVRFRSVPGSAREICAIFLAMAVGLAMGIGYLAYGVIFGILLCAIYVLLHATKFGEMKNRPTEKKLTITIPEDLDYSEIFDDLFQTYTTSHELISVKTISMGSLFKLSYNVTLKDIKTEKEFIDALRCRNGNLEILSARHEMSAETL